MFLGGLLGTLYNLTYVVMVNLILQAVYSSMIMDTFGSMREEAERLEEDMSSRCFICSINRDEFEQVGISFSHHIHDEHNMWKYLFFKIYLDVKDPLSFSGPEHFAFTQMKDKQTFIHLLPIKRSLSLERKTTFGGEDTTLEAIQQAVQSISRSNERILGRLTKPVGDEVESTDGT